MNIIYSIDQYTKLAYAWCNSNYQLTTVIAFYTEAESFSLDIIKWQTHLSKRHLLFMKEQYHVSRQKAIVFFICLLCC